VKSKNYLKKNENLFYQKITYYTMAACLASFVRFGAIVATSATTSVAAYPILVVLLQCQNATTYWFQYPPHFSDY
jgi:hypothetical protein